MKLFRPVAVSSLSPERVRIAKIFKAHIDMALAELGAGYSVALTGRFEQTRNSR